MAGCAGFLEAVRELSPGHRAVKMAGDLVGSGSRADVYEVKGCPRRVVKLSRVSTESWACVAGIFRRVRCFSNPSVMSIYGYGVVYRDPEDTYYYVVSERLRAITREAEGENACAAADLALSREPFSLERLPYGAKQKAVSRFQQFHADLRCLPAQHGDIHWGNIMVDQRGRYKLVDCESMTFSATR